MTRRKARRRKKTAMTWLIGSLKSEQEREAERRKRSRRRRRRN